MDGKGRETAIDDSSAPIKEPGGRVAGVVLVFRDCTEKKKAEAAFRQSQALYHSLVEQMPAGVFRKDAAGRYVFVNSYFCELRKMAPAQFLGKLPRELPDSESAFKSQAAEHHDLIMHTGKSVEVLDEYHRADGNTLYFHVVKTPVFDGNGNIIGSQGVLFDVTGRKKSETAVQDREHLLRQVIDAVPHFIFAKDRQSRNLFVNRACAEANNLTVDQMVGKNDLDFLTNKAEAESLMRNDREVIDSGKAKFIPEERVTGPDGSVRILETIKLPFNMPGLKEPALLGVAVDITARKLAEEKLKREEARFKLIFETLPIGIAFNTTQPDGTSKRIINDAHLRICGLARSQQDEPGIYLRITHPDDLALQQHFSEQIRAGLRKQFSMEKRYLHSDGKVVWVSFSYQREVYPDGSALVLTTAVDISERKAAEEQLRQLAVIVESSEDAIIANNLADIVTSWNHGAQSIFGYSAGEMIGKSVLQLYPPEFKNEETDLAPAFSAARTSSIFRPSACARMESGFAFPPPSRRSGTTTEISSAPPPSPGTSPASKCWRNSCARPRKWRPSASSPAAWPMISTTSWPSFKCRSNSRRWTAFFRPNRRPAWMRSRPPPAAPPTLPGSCCCSASASGCNRVNWT